MIVVFSAGCGSSGNEGDASSEGADNNAETELANDGSEESYVLSFSSFFPAGSHYETEIIDYFDQLLREKSAGRLELEIYSAGSLMTAPDTMDGIKSGLADIGVTYMATIPGRFPVSSIFELPSVYASAKSVTYALRDAMEKWRPEEFDGVKTLMFYGSGPGVLLTQKPIEKVGDIKGLQVRTNSTLARSEEALGGTPVTMQMGEVSEGLRTGVIDAYIGSVETIAGYNLYEVTKYVTFFPFLEANHMMIMNEDRYNSLPADLRQILDEVVESVWRDKIVDFFDNEGKWSLATTEEKTGTTLTVLPDGEIETMLGLLQPVVDDYKKELIDKGYDAETYFKDWQDLMLAYNDLYPNPYQ
jgi:TRAP-type C4-dicarboxylate transport system substrate-binding protein